MVINKAIEALGVTLDLSYNTETLMLSVNGASKNEPDLKGREDLIGIFQTPLSGVSFGTESEFYISKGSTASYEMAVAIGDRLGFSIESFSRGYIEIGVDVCENDIQINP